MPSILEIIGPSMIGPSSSHTLGAMRISKFAYNLDGGTPQDVVFYLHGSFQETYIGHGTWLALIAGLCGITTDDSRVAHADKIAKTLGMKYEFKPVDLGEVHPNTVKIFTTKNGEHHEIIGSSVGGGRIKIISIDSLRCQLDGEYPTLVVENSDVPGALEIIIKTISFSDVNIARLELNRESRYLKRANAVIELDSEPSDSVLNALRHLEVVKSLMYAKAIF